MFEACTVPYFCLKRRVFETERKDSTGSFLFHYKQVVLYLHFPPFTGFFLFYRPCFYSIFLFYCCITCFPCHSRNTLFLLHYTSPCFTSVCYTLFALTPLASLRDFLMCALSFSV